MISSVHNSIIQHAIKLGKYRKYRKKHHSFIMESETHIIDIANQNPLSIDQLIISESYILETSKFPVYIPKKIVSPNVFKHIQQTKTSKGLLAILKKPNWHFDLLKKSNRIVYVDGIQQPFNLGAIVRNATAFKMDAIVMKPETVDLFHPESLRASAGTALTLPSYTYSLPKLKKLFPTHTLITLDPRGTIQIHSLNIPKYFIVAFGPEKGFQDIPKHSQSVVIPMSNNLDSLNVASCSAIIFYYLKNSPQI